MAKQSTQRTDKTGRAKRRAQAKQITLSAKAVKKPTERSGRQSPVSLKTVVGKGIKALFGAVGRVLWLILFPLRPLLRPILRYLVGVRREFREVIWPTRREAWKLTFAVVTFSLVFVLLVQVIDYGVRTLFEKVII